MRIPPEELSRLQACVRDAWDLAEQGRVQAGYELLDLGLIWAETPALDVVTWEQSPLDPWAPELIACYRHELFQYVAEHQSELGNGCLARHAQALRNEAREHCATAQALCRDAAALQERVEPLRQCIAERRRKGTVH